MGFKRVAVTAGVLYATSALAAVSNAKTSLKLLYQNNLNASDDVNHIGAILLDPTTMSNGAAECAAIGETLLTKAAIQNHTSDFFHSFSYLEYAGEEAPNQQYYIANGIVQAGARELTFPRLPASYRQKDLPVLCTQSSNQNSPSNAVATSANEISVESSGNTYVGFRNQKSFRFLGVPFANQPGRFEYSTVYNQTGQTVSATSYGIDCTQAYDPTSGEDCLFTNIQTAYIPKDGSKAHLKPVLFTIYGGGFTGGSGASAGLDGGNLASREDIVAVEINYRLSTLGFLAIPGTDILGNFGIGDQITGLEVSTALLSSRILFGSLLTVQSGSRRTSLSLVVIPRRSPSLENLPAPDLFERFWAPHQSSRTTSSLVASHSPTWEEVLTLVSVSGLNDLPMRSTIC